VARRLDDFQIAKPAGCNLTGRAVDALEPHFGDNFLASVQTCRDGRQRLALTGAFLFPELNRRWTQMNADKKHIPYPSRHQRFLLFGCQYLRGGLAAATNLRPSAFICG